MSIAGFYRSAKFGWNLGCCLLRSIARTTRTTPTPTPTRPTRLYILTSETRDYGVGVGAVEFQLIAASNTHDVPSSHVVLKPQNQKYITYRNTAREGPNNDNRQHAQNLVKFCRVVFELCE